MELRELTQLVARRSSSVQAELLNVDLAGAEVRQSRLLGNPSLDAIWGTIPLGETNPPDLGSPLTRVPYYGLGVSYTFPLGKRGPRQRRALALQEGARAYATATARAQALELARVLGTLAVATLRVEGLKGLVEDEKESVVLAESRLSGGFGTPLEVDRLQIELNRTEQQLLDNEGDIRESLASCATLLGQRCQAFSTPVEARAYLTAWVERGRSATGPGETRPDIQALDAGRRAADAEAEFASAQSIPDPTVRLGYTYDQFVASGNQRHSLNLSVSIPLPFFDHGQAMTQAAEGRRLRLGMQRDRILSSAQVRSASLREALDTRERRREVIVSKSLPRAKAVVGSLEKAAATRLIPLTDVIVARRTLSELLVQEAESYGDAFSLSLQLVAESATGAAAVDDVSSAKEGTQ